MKNILNSLNLSKILFLIVMILVLSGCAHNEVVKQCLSGHTYGFWGGIWHGIIAPFDFLGMIFGDNITMYAQNNNGIWYAFGFLIGSGGWGFLGGKALQKAGSVTDQVMNPEFELLAPCGIHCGLCKRYLRFEKDNHNKSSLKPVCVGCRPRNKYCTFIERHCSTLKKGLIRFCFECEEFPCAHSLTLDKRYQRKYAISLISNLKYIEDFGEAKFKEYTEGIYTCSACGNLTSIHENKCEYCKGEK